MSIYCKCCGGECKETSVNGRTVAVCNYCGAEQTVAAPMSAVSPNPFTASFGGALTGDQLYEKVIDSVVEIRVTSPNASASASGFVVSDEGYILTNAHAVLNKNGKLFEKIYIKYKGQYYAALPVAIGSPYGTGSKDSVDLCLLYTGRLSKCNVSDFGDIDSVKNGQKVYLIGNSLGEGTCITSGIISDRARAISGLSYPYIMTDAAANPGNSGGPLYNEQGQIIGVLVAGINTAKGMNYAIPANIAEGFLSYVVNNTRLKEVPLGQLEKYRGNYNAANYALGIGTVFAGVRLLLDAIEYLLGLFGDKK